MIMLPEISQVELGPCWLLVVTEGFALLELDVGLMLLVKPPLIDVTTLSDFDDDMRFDNDAYGDAESTELA